VRKFRSLSWKDWCVVSAHRDQLSAVSGHGPDRQWLFHAIGAALAAVLNPDFELEEFVIASETDQEEIQERFEELVQDLESSD
jgi:hypothetical protein